MTDRVRLEVRPRWEDEQPTKVTVHGQEFLVRPRPGEIGTYDFDWTTGPNEGYGFTSASYDSHQLSLTEMEDAVLNFLDQVDPGTGR